MLQLKDQIEYLKKDIIHKNFIIESFITELKDSKRNLNISQKEVGINTDLNNDIRFNNPSVTS